ncbi:MULTISPECIES: FAD-dependent oxidoreductase [unclassified Mesorhizobium]|uniref:NAD(P)/FAD-dependent oxidoreductase n=1 Tax=unclassified Mesorhizobium TaxID=325217 RepID=UPI000FCA0F0F|nr:MULTISPECIES: FAD-dependent oxidoreductase [unclassified Mesorhizobium]RUX97232.1 FAD-binding oxidoreductase [Mesorhizobium sp. M7D.F.Ca.US.004.01.2.1]RVA32524.1 FAD-binding oxidoreductase [Mesorhizobium sp. M7D.F.Ca.US.004.03.1.1]
MARTFRPNRAHLPTEAIVIGGGIAGCTLAYELASNGIKTIVIEQNVIAAESSGRNTGTLLSGPQSEVVQMLDACVPIYEELADGPVPFEFERIGHLLIAEDDETLEKAEATAHCYRQAGVGMERATGTDLANDHPALGFNVAGGYFVERAWTLEPMGATHAFAHAARQAGAVFQTGTRVAQIHTRNGKVQGVLTDQGILTSDMVFIANGLWANDVLRRTVGDDPLPGLPLSAGRGWLVQLGALGFRIPWIVEEFTWPDQEELGKRMSLRGLEDLARQRDDQIAVEAICLNPMKGGDARLGATVQPAFRDLVRNTDIASRMAARTLRMIRGLDVPTIRNVYPGNRPMLPDGLPVAGPTRIEGLFVHGGMGSIGMHAAPATARWLVDAVLNNGGGQITRSWLSPNRFAGWDS